VDWSGLELTGEDNLVDGWWTRGMLTAWRTHTRWSRARGERPWSSCRPLPCTRGPSNQAGADMVCRAPQSHEQRRHPGRQRLNRRAGSARERQVSGDGEPELADSRAPSVEAQTVRASSLRPDQHGVAQVDALGLSSRRTTSPRVRGSAGARRL
jgi:hypothetical protein